jgi:shikimate-5-dehydrogenase
MAQSTSSSNDRVTPKSFHIFGKGISFSISPTIHNAGFTHYDLPYKYDIRESSNIDGVAGLILDKQFGGASVTMPHKLQVHKLCTDQTETARLIGAINTLVVKGSGDERRIIGDNTDWSGLHRIISDYATRTGQQSNVGLVIGAGGASRAALYAMHRAGIQRIYLVNRTLATAEKVRQDFESVFEITVIPTLEELPQHPDVIVGTVPAETTTEDQFSGIFGTRGLCIDMSYKPRQTPLLSVAQRTEGWYTVTGVEVLLAQAYDQFYLWTGCEPPREKMIEAVAKHEREKARGGSNGGLL